MLVAETGAYQYLLYTEVVAGHFPFPSFCNRLLLWKKEFDTSYAGLLERRGAMAGG